MYYYHYFIAEVAPVWFADQGFPQYYPVGKAVFSSIALSWFMAVFIYLRTAPMGPVGLILALLPAGFMLPNWLFSPTLVNGGYGLGWICVFFVFTVPTILLLIDGKKFIAKDVNNGSLFEAICLYVLLYTGPVLLITTWFIF